MQFSIPITRWYQALNVRPFRWRFIPEPLPDADLQSLKAFTDKLNKNVKGLAHGVYGKWSFPGYPVIAEYIFNAPLPVLLETYYGHQASIQQKKRYKKRLVPLKPEKYSITAQLEKLPLQTGKILKQMGDIAKEKGVRIFLVGGVLRDFFWGKENRDLDFVIIGGKIEEIIIEAATALQGKYQINTHFRTGSITLPGGYNLDLAEARRESYSAPGVLPEVEVTEDILEDLFRRDYTINTLALDVTPANWGELLDPFRGLGDIKKGILRTLHRYSFLDDPTRIIRGIRLLQQTGFSFEKETRELIAEALTINPYSSLVPVRIIKELRFLFSQEVTGELLEVLRAIPVFRLLNLNPEIDQRLVKQSWELEEYLRKFPELEGWVLRFALFVDNVPPEELKNWEIKEDYKKVMLSYRSHLHLLEELEAEMAAIELVKKLSKLSLAEIIVLLVKVQNEQVKNNLKEYLQLSRIKREITGNDLLKMGLKPGPAIQKILNRVYQAKLKGEITTRDEEMAYARSLIRQYLNFS